MTEHMLNSSRCLLNICSTLKMNFMLNVRWMFGLTRLQFAINTYRQLCGFNSGCVVVQLCRVQYYFTPFLVIFTTSTAWAMNETLWCFTSVKTSEAWEKSYSGLICCELVISFEKLVSEWNNCEYSLKFTLLSREGSFGILHLSPDIPN